MGSLGAPVPLVYAKAADQQRAPICSKEGGGASRVQQEGPGRHCCHHVGRRRAQDEVTTNIHTWGVILPMWPFDGSAASVNYMAILSLMNDRFHSR
eukprot:1826630-Pleurochrysis_carterae.AAC.1